MMLLRLSALVAVVVALSALPIVAGAYTTIGQLVYNFTYSANQNITSRDSSDNAESYASTPQASKGQPAGADTPVGTNGMNHYDPSQLDSSKHWQVVQNNGDGSDINADYTIDRNNNGVMQIGEKRKVRLEGAGHLTTNIETSIGYDYSRLVPTSVDEYATQRTDAGLKGNSTTTYQTTLNLVTDTMART